MVNNSITLTASMRSNLMSLKTIATQMDRTQNILSTGKKVNSAIDNASSYYQARSLTNRAGDLNSLLDAMGQGIQTIQAATQGLESATSYLEQMKSVAEQALTMEAKPMNSKVELVDNSQELLAQGYTAVYNTDDLINAMRENAKIVLMNDIELDKNYSGSFSNIIINGSGHTLNLNDKQFFFFSGSNQVVENINVELGTNSTDLGVTTLRNANITCTSSVAETEAHIISNISEFENVNVKANVNASEITGILLNKNNMSIKNVTMDIVGSSDSIIKVLANHKYAGGNINLDINGLAVSAQGKEVYGIFNNRPTDPSSSIVVTGVDDWSIEGINNAFAEIDVKDNHKQYSSIMTQFDELVEDTSYQGVNLLTGGNLTVTFNESRTHELTVKGKDMRTEKLGLSTKNWQDKKDIEDALEELTTAMGKIRSFSAELGNNYAIIQTRQDFTDALVDVLETGADNLVLADMNEASAQYLMLQTRQQLATNSLSLASQSAQSILSLF